ncbi:MAG: hypothetical protein ACFFBU_06165, partial [Promethearchaeota archaeon]
MIWDPFPLKSIAPKSSNGWNLQIPIIAPLAHVAHSRGTSGYSSVAYGWLLWRELAADVAPLGRAPES